MQWFIDIITALFSNRHRFFDRGDPADLDYDKDDLTRDDAWHDLDLSAVVPANSVLVLFRITIQANNIADLFQMRTNGNVNWPNFVNCRLQASNVPVTYDKLVACDTSRIIEYKASNFGWAFINITIAGWWLQ